MTLQGHRKSMIYVILKPVCDFLLVINTNRPYLAPFSHNTSVTDKTDKRTNDNHDKELTFKFTNYTKQNKTATTAAVKV